MAQELVEVESGTRRDHPQLAAALAACRARRATLVVARLNRLARNVAFVSALMEAGVEFVAADMPSVTRLTVHILAAVAEEEARLVSVRTRSALAAAKARGVQLSNPQLRAGSADQARVATTAKVGQARTRAADVLPFVRQAQAAGATSLHQLAVALTAGRHSHPVRVRRLAPRQRPLRPGLRRGSLAGASYPADLPRLCPLACGQCHHQARHPGGEPTTSTGSNVRPGGIIA